MDSALRATVGCLVLIVLCVSFVDGRELNGLVGQDGTYYNGTLARILVQYASAVYSSDLTSLFEWSCERCDGLIKDFEMVEVIVNVENCLQAFVGVDHGLNSIIVAFRGTQENSIQNWIEDLFWKQLDLNYPDMPGAMVHHGFYSAYHNTTLRQEIINTIGRIRKLHGNVGIIVTGHSLGGALATFCALDIAVNYGVRDVQLMTFGQPRVGNSAFASSFRERVPRAARVTHENDIVPHLPPYYSYFSRKSYHHFATEVWIHGVELNGLTQLAETICDDSGEDPTCSRSVYGKSVSDHLRYFDVDLCADARGNCRFVIDKTLLQHSRPVAGSVILSKDPVPHTLIDSS